MLSVYINPSADVLKILCNIKDLRFKEYVRIILN